MKRIRKILILVLACCFVLTCSLLVAACTKPVPEHTVHTDADKDGFCDVCGEPVENSTDDPTLTGKITYTVNLQRSGGDPLPNVTVLPIDEEGNIAAAGATDENGVATFSLNAGTYTVQFSLLPEGYSATDTYTMSAEEPNVTIKLSASVIKKTPANNVTYTLGSVLYDFAFVDSTGYESSLSELLATKRAVLLNFWYTTCSWCIYEFPDMMKVYGDYEDKIAVVAIDTNSESQSAVEKFRQGIGYEWEDTGLPFHMIGADSNGTNTQALSLTQRFGFTAAPVSVMIDREGVVCFVGSGAGSEDDFRELFAKFTADDYVQDIIYPDEQEAPKPDVDAPSSEEIEAAINNTSTGFTASYYFIPEGQESSHEYSWPWVVDSVDGEACIRPTNTRLNSSYAMIYADIYAASDEQIIAFDVKPSCETLNGVNGYGDALYVFVDGTLVTYYTGISDGWYTCYAYFPLRAGTYTLSLAYVKDYRDHQGDDTVYVRNMRFVGSEEVDHLVEMPYHAADGDVQGGQYTYYITPVYNEEDGYYHVGTADGPLLLADLMNENTHWSNRAVWEGYILSGGLTWDLDGDGVKEDYTAAMTQYCAVANNSELYGLVAVTKDLAEMLHALTARYGDGSHQDTEWLELCMYYKRYGVPAGEARELPDPARGLAAYNAFEAVINTGTESEPTATNLVDLNRVLMPRGLWYRVTIPETGVYCARSIGTFDTYGWLRDSNGEILQESDDIYFNPDDFVGSDGNFCMNFFAREGEIYYVCCAFSFMDELGTFEFIVTRIVDKGDFWTPASASEYTWELVYDEDGNAMTDANGDLLLGDVILAGAIEFALGEDGYYYAKNADGSLGSRIYVNLAFGTSAMFPDLAIAQMLDLDVTYCTECGVSYDGPYSGNCYVCGARASKLATRKAFELPTPVYDANGKVKTTSYPFGTELIIEVPEYERDENGDIIFVDYTETMRAYVARATTGGEYPTARGDYDADHYGYIDADETLVDILMKFIIFGDHSINANISNAWLMLSSYYLHLGE